MSRMRPSGTSITPAIASRIAWPNLELPANEAPKFAQGMSPTENAALMQYHLALKNVLDHQLNAVNTALSKAQSDLKTAQDNIATLQKNAAAPAK